MLEVSDIVKTYDKSVHAVKGITFDTKENEIMGLLGPNGAGKSSTFNMITLQTRRTSGHIKILGRDI